MAHGEQQPHEELPPAASSGSAQRYEELSRLSDIELGRQVEDPHAATILLERHWGLLTRTAQSVLGHNPHISGISVDDLVQEGALGFLRAIPDFDPHQEKGLAAYANNRGLGRMLAYINAQGYQVHLSDRILAKLQKSHGREAERMTTEQLEAFASELGLHLDPTNLGRLSILDLLFAKQVIEMVSLDDPQPHPDEQSPNYTGEPYEPTPQPIAGQTPADAFEDFWIPYREQILMNLPTLLQASGTTLAPRQNEILSMWLNGLNYSEIASHLGISKRRASNTVQEALRKLTLGQPKDRLRQYFEEFLQ